MLPVFRWFLCGLFALWSCVALAQAAAQPPEIDESKIPEWVKRQARSPYKVIIESNAVKAKPAPAPAPAPPKDDAKVVAKKSPVKAAAPAASEAAGKSPPLAAAAASNSSAARPAAAEQTLGDSATSVVAPAAAVPALPAAAELEVRTARLAPALAPAAEPQPLTLVKRVEPALSAGLLDGRLATAKVVVAFTVTTSGEVANLSVASTSDPRLNRSVLRAVQAWRYAPIPEPREHMVSFAFSVE